MLKLDHLSLADHEAAAKLLAQVQNDLTALAHIVQRAPFTDTVMRAQKRIQKTLIGPLDEALDKLPGGRDLRHTRAIYPSVHYAIGR